MRSNRGKHKASSTTSKPLASASEAPGDLSVMKYPTEGASVASERQLAPSASSASSLSGSATEMSKGWWVAVWVWLFGFLLLFGLELGQFIYRAIRWALI